jgi:hypothetical protein
MSTVIGRPKSVRIQKRFRGGLSGLSGPPIRVAITHLLCRVCSSRKQKSKIFEQKLVRARLILGRIFETTSLERCSSSMGNEPDGAGENVVESGEVLSFRDGIYRLRLRLSAIDAPQEIVLHGVSRLADALRVARFFEENPLSHAP